MKAVTRDVVRLRWRLSIGGFAVIGVLGCTPHTHKPTVDSEHLSEVGGVAFIAFEGGEVHMTVDRPLIDVPPFEMMRHEVTTASFRACVADGGCSGVGGQGGRDCNQHYAQRGQLPINCMTARDAAEFATWFGYGARLPTEAEWVFAAGGTQRRYPWGDEGPTCANAATQECEGLKPICSLSAGQTPAPRELCDMGGNVAELLEDDWHEGYDCDNVSLPAGIRPFVPLADACSNGGSIPRDGSAWNESSRSAYRVIRGGSDRLPRAFVANAKRHPAVAHVGDVGVGFRLARTP